MARAILVIGEPGTGKSRAIRDLDPKETVVIKPNKKEFPFPGGAVKYQQGKNVVITTDLRMVGQTLMDIGTKYKHVKNVIIEDVTHFFSKRTIDERKKTGYGKWMELAASIKQNIVDKEVLLRDDLTIFVIGHVDEKADKTGKPELTLHTPGKLLDRSILLTSYFTYMFHTDLISKADGSMQYRFLSNRTEFKVAKTPEGIFPLYITNNYELIKRYIIAYQTLTEVNLDGIDESIEVSQEVVQYAVPEAVDNKKADNKEEDSEDPLDIPDDGMGNSEGLEETGDSDTTPDPSVDTGEVSI